MEMKDEDILIRLISDEDHFVEKKTRGDKKDWLKSAVAFANSAPIGYPAILFLGVKDDGAIEDLCDCDEIQKAFNKEVAKAYPPIYYLSKVLNKDGKSFIACIIPGSDLRPHFAGHSYIRKGSETFSASEQEFQLLIAQRNSKAYEIRKWIEKTITIVWINHDAGQLRVSGRESHRWEVKILSCTQHFVTFMFGDGRLDSLPLEDVRISYDHERNRLKLEMDWTK
jgi:predicted HTH transcriptional regulator